MPRQTLKVTSQVRLDSLLVQTWPQLDRVLMRSMVQSGEVLVNGQSVNKVGILLQEGDTVELEEPILTNAPEEEESLIAPMLPLEVLYEDQYLAVVEKPADLPLKSTSKRYPEATLADRLIELFPEAAHVGGANRAGLITTLEKGISGPVLMAKDEATYRTLQRALKHQNIRREYTALVEGRLRGNHLIEQPVGNVKRTRNLLMVSREGRPAITEVKAQRYYKEGARGFTLVTMIPQTARRHQMRVHIAWYGLPIVGDRLYGDKRLADTMLADRMFLHLSQIIFPHPETQEDVRIQSALPQELHSVIQYLTRPKSFTPY